MTSKITMANTFDQPWPQVLIDISDWIRTQAVLAGQARRMEVFLSFSRASLLEAKREGKTMQPVFDEFRQELKKNLRIDIPLPNEQRGFHKDGPHKAEFNYWR